MTAGSVFFLDIRGLLDAAEALGDTAMVVGEREKAVRPVAKRAAVGEVVARDEGLVGVIRGGDAVAGAVSAKLFASNVAALDCDISGVSLTPDGSSKPAICRRVAIRSAV